MKYITQKRLLSYLVLIFSFPSCLFAQKIDNLFEDSDFQKGFTVVSIEKGKQGILNFNKSNSVDVPFWTLCQHYSRYNIAESPIQFISDNIAEYKNEGKRVRLERNEANETILFLDVYADQEYQKTRKLNEPWPHLLISHDFPFSERLNFSKTQSFEFSMDVRIGDCQNLMSSDDYDPALHCAQTTAYFVIVNDSPNSPDYQDYIWFGVPIFDSRYEIIEPYAELDGDPKILGTGKLIYTLGGKEIFDKLYDHKNPKNHEWVHLQVNLLDYIPSALETAQKRGLLTQTSLSDLNFAHFNLGWEVPGGFRCSMEIKNIKLSADLKNDVK
ncbi:MAG: hypothetical protein Q4C95_04025 [Planctomycetia bacterium]|nr:hypothetical protein [Planctomycetia bacterium]